MVHPLALSCDRHKKGKSRGNVLAPNRRSSYLTYHTVVLDDKEGAIQRAGCQLPGDRLRWLHLRAIVLGHSIDLTHDSVRGNAR